MALIMIEGRPGDGMKFNEIAGHDSIELLPVINIRSFYIKCSSCNGRGHDFLGILRCESCRGSGRILVDPTDQSLPF